MQPDRVRFRGPLQDLAPVFRDELARRGYSDVSATRHLRVMAQLSRWIERKGVAVPELTADVIGEFLDHQRSTGHEVGRAGSGLSMLLGLLAPMGPSVPVKNGGAGLSGRYAGYLARERGLADGTVVKYMQIVDIFLALHDSPLDGVCRLSAGDVVNFVSYEARDKSPAYAKRVVSALRSFLRFCRMEGLIDAPLDEGVPAVTRYHMTSVPRYFEAAEVAAMLATCDRATAMGQRDFAVLVIMSRLGLRSCEVSRIDLDDLDWRCGAILVRGKAKRHERLPMPNDVGEALVGYLRGGRPTTQSRALFIRCRAPHERLSTSGVWEVVARAGALAGVDNPASHRLRHTVATEMLAKGAPLEEIAQALRHANTTSTAIYAKVDLGSLRRLCRQWPVAS
jgi:integrase/recombinase XerD